MGTFYRDLVLRTFIEILPRGLLQRSCRQSSYTNFYGDLFKPRDLLHGTCTEILPKDLLEGDLVQRSCQETSDTDLVRRPGEENADLVQRYFLASLNKDLALRSLKEIFCGDLLQTPCTDSFTKGFCTAALQRTRQENGAGNLLQRSSQRELAESNLAPLLPETAFRPAILEPLMILGSFNFTLLTVHCLGSIVYVYGYGSKLGTPKLWMLNTKLD